MGLNIQKTKNVRNSLTIDSNGFSGELGDMMIP